jgi:endo-1,4-beta-mannosidase
MGEKELHEIEKRSEAEMTLSMPYNIFAEYCSELIAEIKRLNDNIWFKQGDMEELQQEVQRYKQALELILEHSPYSRQGEIAYKALRGGCE